MKFLRLWFLAFVLTGLKLGTPVSAKTLPGPLQAKVSPPEVIFQVTAVRDAVHLGDNLSFVCSVVNHSQVPLDNLQITILPVVPNDALFAFTLPEWQPLPAFGSETQELTGKVTDKAEFEPHHLVFVLQYTWKADSATYTSTQAAAVNIQVSRKFEEESKGLPGGTAALLYLILPAITIFFSYGFFDSWRREGKPRIPEFKSEYVVPAFLGAIVLNFVLVYEWQHDQSYLYATPKRFALSLLVLAGVGAVIPMIRWVVKGWEWALYTLRAGDSPEKYLDKVLHQSPTGGVTWRKAKIEGVEWTGALLHQPNGNKVLGACLQISAKQGKLNAEQLKAVVDENGKIADIEKLRKLLKARSVTLDFAKRITGAGRTKEMLFVEDKDMEPMNDGPEAEKIVKFVQ